MIWQLVKSGLKRQPLLWAAAAFFFLLTVTLFALSTMLGSQLMGAVDGLMDRCQVPDYIQMHAGTIDPAELRDFSKSSGLAADWQAVPFLKLDNARISLAGQSLADSTQDNGLCPQAARFDLLPDLEDRLPDVQPGEVYIPAVYRSLYGLKTGELMTIGSDSLIIAGFIRDGQMNSMLCSSKRFLVHPQTLERLSAAGEEETLIEFRLQTGVSASQFEAAYRHSGLPQDGPAVTRPLVRMMNALSEGTGIFVILLVSLAVLGISILCLCFLTNLQLEQDSRMTGMMKVLGISRRDIYRMYACRFALLAGASLIPGILLAWILHAPLSTQVRLLYGSAGSGISTAAACLISGILASLLILMAVRHSLKRLDRQPPVRSLYPGSAAKKSKLPVIQASLSAVCVFLLLVPLFLSAAIRDPSFVTYMGIGNAGMRLDLRQPDLREAVVQKLQEDPAVARSVLLDTYALEAAAGTGTSVRLFVETGDLQAFPVTCQEGRLPETADELLLSTLAARELDAGVGDRIRLAGQEGTFLICGLYADITNGGLCAKAARLQSPGSQAWSTAYVTLQEGADAKAWKKEMASYQANPVSIQEHVRQTCAQILDQLDQSIVISAVLALFISVSVMFLWICLDVQRSRAAVSLKKALGIPGIELKRTAWIRSLAWSAVGAGCGILLAAGPGQWACSLILDRLGAAGFSFRYPLVPLGALVCLVMAGCGAGVWAGLKSMDGISPCECLRGKE